MALLFHDEELIELMKDFYVLTGIRMALFDETGTELMSYPAHEEHFCSCMRKSPSFRENCRVSDEHSFLMCRRSNKMHVFKCHAGLIEASVPIMDRGRVIGYMMFGGITDQKNKDDLLSLVTTKCRGYEIDGALREKIKKIKYRNENQIRAAAKILDACTEYVRLKEIVHPSGKRLIDSVEKYIEQHISEQISVERLCNEFDISRTRLYETIAPYTHGGIAAFVKQKKLECAKNLVKTTDMSIPQIADAVGFADYNYFLRAFKKRYGISTKKMRKGGEE